MRYVKIPSPIPDMGRTADGKSAPFEFRSFLAQFVWRAELWRASNDAVGSFMRATGALAEATEGVVAIENEDFERVAEAARAAHASFDPTIVVPLMRFVYAITSASSTAPAGE